MKATKLLGIAISVSMMLAFAGEAFAQEKTTVVTAPSVFTGMLAGAPLKAIGAGLVMIGASLGFARIGAAALESMARQPEVAGRIQTAMIIIGALLEGATFFALIVCISV